MIDGSALVCFRRSLPRWSGPSAAKTWSVLFQRVKRTNRNVAVMSDTSRTDWKALAEMSDSQIDYSDIPPLSDEFFDRAALRIPAAQARSLVPLDPDVLAWFQ